MRDKPPEPTTISKPKPRLLNDQRWYIRGYNDARGERPEMDVTGLTDEQLAAYQAGRQDGLALRLGHRARERAS